jgi:hypothetical protein
MNHKIRQWSNLIAVVLTIAMNGLANALPLNGLTTGEISDRFDVFFVPAGYVFSIWGLIYIGLAAFALYQALPSQGENPRLQRIGYLFILSSIANIAWLFLWHYELFTWTLIAMLTLLITLIGIYLRLQIGREQVTSTERWLVNVPFSIYLGWVTVATIANVTSVLDYLNWGGWGVSPEIWTVVMLVAGLMIASAISLTRGDSAYLLVIVWAFIGIAFKHSSVAIISTTAYVIAALVAGLILVNLLQKRSQSRAIPAS